MKTKDIVLLLVAAVMFAVTGFVAFTQLAPKKAAGNNPKVQVVVVPPISPDFDQAALSKINDNTQVVDYSVKIDVTGLGNAAPFGSQ